MKYQLFFAFIIVVTICFSCHTIGNHPADDTVKAKIIHLDGSPGKNVVPTIWVMEDSLIKMDFVNVEKGMIASAEGTMNSKNRVVVEVNVGQADSLLADLSQPNGGDEIAFTRILFRNTITDGFFGSFLHMGISQPGSYRLFISQTKAETPAGKFKIKVWLK